MSKISKNGSKDKIQKCKGDRLAWHLRVIEDVMCTDEGIDCVGDVIRCWYCWLVNLSMELTVTESPSESGDDGWMWIHEET